jgi:hypothetical protein
VSESKDSDEARRAGAGVHVAAANSVTTDGGSSGGAEYMHTEGIELSDMNVAGGYAPLNPAARSSRQAATGRQALHMSSAAALALDMNDDEDDADDNAAAPAAPTATEDGEGVAAVAVAVAVAPSSAAPNSPEPVGVGINSRGRPVKIVGSSCSICLADYVDGEQLKVLPCKHAFHVQCIGPWLDRSDECAVCRASVNDALEIEPACCAWCCEPTVSLAQRGAAIARARQRQQDEEQQRGRAEAQRARAQVQRVHGEQELQQPSGSSFGGHALAAPAAVAPGPGVIIVHAEPADSPRGSVGGPSGYNGGDDPFHAERIRQCVMELLAVVRAHFGDDESSSSVLPLMQLRLQATQLANLSRAGALTSAAALPSLRRMLEQLPAVHAHFSGARRGRDDITEAAVTLDSVIHFAIDQIQRTQKT